MASRKKEAAGNAPAAAPKSETVASPATVGTDTNESSAVSQTVQTAAPDVVIEAAAFIPINSAAAGNSVLSVGEATSEGDASVAAAGAFAQQPGQLASVLAGPVLDIGAPEGGVASEAQLLEDGHPAEIELGGRTVMVQARAERGRWRIGRHFTRTPQPVNIDELTEDEVGRLLADPELIVSLD